MFKETRFYMGETKKSNYKFYFVLVSSLSQFGVKKIQLYGDVSIIT